MQLVNYVHSNMIVTVNYVTLCIIVTYTCTQGHFAMDMIIISWWVIQYVIYVHKVCAAVIYMAGGYGSQKMMSME